MLVWIFINLSDIISIVSSMGSVISTKLKDTICTRRIDLNFDYCRLLVSRKPMYLSSAHGQIWPFCNVLSSYSVFVDSLDTTTITPADNGGCASIGSRCIETSVLPLLAASTSDSCESML